MADALNVWENHPERRVGMSAILMRDVDEDGRKPSTGDCEFGVGCENDIMRSDLERGRSSLDWERDGDGGWGCGSTMVGNSSVVSACSGEDTGTGGTGTGTADSFLRPSNFRLSVLAGGATPLPLGFVAVENVLSLPFLVRNLGIESLELDEPVELEFPAESLSLLLPDAKLELILDIGTTRPFWQ